VASEKRINFSLTFGRHCAEALAGLVDRVKFYDPDNGRTRAAVASDPVPPVSVVWPAAVVPVPSARTSRGCRAAFECAATANRGRFR
jgi:hypothetical protein